MGYGASLGPSGARKGKGNMRRLDTATDPPWFAAAVYGRSGSGKTSLAVTAPKPLVLLSESQGMLSIRQAAKRLNVPVPAVFGLEHLDDARSVLRALRGPRDQPFRIFEYVGTGADRKKELLFELPEWPDTVVLDSVTDILRLVVEEIREQSPQKQGRDGLPIDSERYWNVLGDRCQNLLLGFRDAPVHKLFLCAEDDRMEGEGDERKRSLGPSMPMRKLPALLSGCVNLTAYAYRRELRVEKTVQVRYGVLTTGPEYMLLKPCRPLRDHEVPDFGLWVKAVRGALEQPLPPAPPPSGESLAGPVSDADRPVDSAESAADAESIAQGTAALGAAAADASPTAARSRARRAKKAGG